MCIEIDENSTSQNKTVKENREKKFTTQLRWRRIVQNDIENVPLALIIFWASIIVNSNASVICITSVFFTIFRVLHTFLYAKRIQPWRSLTYALGQLMVLICCITMFICSYIEH